MKSKTLLFILFCLLALGCAPGVNSAIHQANDAGIIAGFWRGLWHGLIAPVTFIISLFNNGVQMYEVHNNGGWYNAGFLLGMSCVFGGGGHGASRRKRRARS